MIKTEIINRTRRKIKKTFLDRIIKKTLFLSDWKGRLFSLSVALVGVKEIQALNKIYRKKNKPTDVLSFNLSSEYNKGKSIEGELILCLDVISQDARKNKVTFERELIFVLSHGVLHVLGFKHGKKMYDLQDKVCKILNPKS